VEEREEEEEEEGEAAAAAEEEDSSDNKPRSPAGRFISGGAPAAAPASVVKHSQYNSKIICIYLEKEYITCPFTIIFDICTFSK
jgi:hypothetical protein